LSFWLPHIDGIPIRKLADERKLSPAQTYERIIAEMDSLPDNTWLTAKYCNRFCGILIMDGKYVKVRGYKEKIPFIYGIDYLTHDPLVGILAPSENEEAFLKFFRLLKTCNYPLQIAVADDRSSLIPALKHHYPRAHLQLCQNHYIENIRQTLHIRTDKKHHHFFNSLCLHVFKEHTGDRQLNDVLHHLLTKRADNNPLRQTIIMGIHRRRKELFAYTKISHCPPNTNLIELYNSHLQARLKSIKGFKSFRAADRWLNAYLIRRRTKNLTDCDTKFKHLNKKCSFQMTLKKQADWPDILGVKTPEKAPKTER
jgi:transposase-like protein